MPKPAQSPPPRLCGSQLEVGYGEQPILNGVDFAVAEAELTVLLGSNGSGKSTLLKTLARTLQPSAGQVLLDGKSIHQQPTRQVAQQLGILPQSPSAPEGLTVRELVALGRFPYQHLLSRWSAADEAAVDRALHIADVARFADRPVDALSGGQRQRCWIAMVLAQETELILLDEPTTYLDLKVQVDLMELLVRLAHEDKRTLLVVLHDLNLAAAYADRLVLMRDGTILETGTPERVFTATNLARVFDLEAHVITDPHSRRRLCVPVINASEDGHSDLSSSRQNCA